MRKLIAMLMLAASVTPGVAAPQQVKMPRDLTGTWCHSNDFELETVYTEIVPNQKCDPWIKFESYGFRSADTDCTATKVTIIGREPQLVTPIYDIRFQCAKVDQSEKRTVRGKMSIGRGMLGVHWGPKGN